MGEKPLAMFTVKFKDRKVTKRILLHDSHTTPDIERAADLLKLNGLKMGLVETGYHFIIERDGMIVSPRPLEQIGAAAPGFDLDSIHICLVGGRDNWNVGAEPHVRPSDNFTPEQRQALFITIQLIRQAYPALPIYGHDEVQRFKRPGAKCPCLDMDELRHDYHTFIATNGAVY